MPGMALESQDVVRELALEEAARVASRDRDDGEVGQQRGAYVRHRDIVAQRISANARLLAVGRPDPFWQNSLAMPQSADRPLSPHLQVYRPMYTMVLSILHRASGLYLSACGFLFVAWLSAAALGPDAYACATDILAGLPMRIVLAIALAAFWYHLFAGIRHLAWDVGIRLREEGGARGPAPWSWRWRPRPSRRQRC